MNVIANRLKIVMGELTVRKFAERLSMSPTTVQEYLKGRTPPADFIVRVCDQFDVDSWWLLTGRNIEAPSSVTASNRKQISKIPAIQESLSTYDKELYNEVGVYALAGAGPARELVEHDPIEMIVIPKSFWKPSIAAIKVRGRSMEPLILDGAYLGIDREDKWIISGEIYAVWIPYEGAVIKRLYIDPERITLRSDNKDFPEFSILVKEASAEMILGRVKWVLQHF